MSTKQILSIGQCFADHGAIERTFQKHFAAEVIGADTASEALDLLRQQSFHLILVNRVFDADGAGGIEFVRQLKANEQQTVPVMLVSNYEDAQRQAVAAGAVPGFGKAALGHPAMIARVASCLGK